MNLIAAVDRNNGIGKGNKLLFHIPEDMRFFKKKTVGKTVVMGRRTLESLPGKKPLPGRENIVLSKVGLPKTVEGVTVCSSVEELFEIIKNKKKNDVFVIGGEAVYMLLAPYCEKAYITEVDAAADADRFLALSDNWVKKTVSEEKFYNDISYRFAVYKNFAKHNIDV
jgi:dihydrofolate reductase